MQGVINGQNNLPIITTPTTPPVGFVGLYQKLDGLYYVDSTGTEHSIGGGGAGAQNTEIWKRFDILSANPVCVLKRVPDNSIYFLISGNNTVLRYDLTTRELVSAFTPAITSPNDLHIGTTSDYIVANQLIYQYNRLTGVLGAAAAGGTGLRACVEHNGHIYTALNNSIQKRDLALTVLSTIPVTGSNCFCITAEGDDIVFSYSSGSTFIVSEATFTIKHQDVASSVNVIRPNHFMLMSSATLIAIDKTTYTQTPIFTGGSVNFLGLDDNQNIYVFASTGFKVDQNFNVKLFTSFGNTATGLRGSRNIQVGSSMLVAVTSNPSQAILATPTI